MTRTRTFGLILLLLSVILGTAILYHFVNGAGQLSSLYLEEDAYQKLTSTRAEDGTLAVENLTFNEQVLSHDYLEDKYFYSVVEDHKDGFNPRITYTGKCRIAFLNSEITSEQIEKNEPLTMVLYTDSAYREVAISVTTLPILEITGGLQIPDDSTEDYSVSMKLYDNRSQETAGWIISEGKMHIKGQGSRVYPKKGYKLSLIDRSLGGHERQNDLSLLGMRTDDDWILNGVYNDQEKVRNAFSMNLWTDTVADRNSLGIENGIHYEYVEMIMDGHYWGLYTIGYPIDDKLLGITEESNDYLLKKLGWNWLSLYGDIESLYEIKSKGKTDYSEILGMYESYVGLIDWTNWEDYPFDYENLLCTNLFIELIQGGDNVGWTDTRNMMISALTDENGERIWMYTPWDVDLSWGNIGMDGALNHTATYAVDETYNVGVRLFPIQQVVGDGYDQLYPEYYEYYLALRETVWTDEVFLDAIDGYEEDIYNSGAYLREMSRWPEGTYQDPDEKLDTFREYVIARLHYMDDVAVQKVSAE